ncbi:type II toxin-antitoxin system VapC family toxin [Merismopedia glauca]|uniref:Nuclease n=1 Tax=Merismopedia glauca CCAP 1448/3 TaxID=1296344 RepID=A0A2T1C622_9CYAN|nr:type II toxin-antitoxin system VapC family toxin [Merismopedia glauca]PSB03711.1 nuclease [Merismopedia glauca CCAP 1448/3]
MTLWILDTDCVSLFLEGNQQIGKEAAAKFPDVGITIVTVQEIFNGWVGRINDPSQAHQLVSLYTKLWRATEFFKRVTIFNFNETSQIYHANLLAENKLLAKKRLEKDTRIAAIVLANNGIMVTRNRKDFSLIPSLQIEDWTC